MPNLRGDDSRPSRDSTVSFRSSSSSPSLAFNASRLSASSSFSLVRCSSSSDSSSDEDVLRFTLLSFLLASSWRRLRVWSFMAVKWFCPGLQCLVMGSSCHGILAPENKKGNIGLGFYTDLLEQGQDKNKISNMPHLFSFWF